ncbi:hypothetical protein C8R44DRAFT_869784 [Mycena epipterygia]|nr:hypothetical protein C8R44DRAFT_869784 [Mycena epipterygia]
MALCLAKYGVKAKIIEASTTLYETIPTMLAILGVKDEFDAAALRLPPLQMAVYDPTGKNIIKAFKWSQPAEDFPTVPFRNLVTINQAKLEAILRDRVNALGYDVEYGKKFVGTTQDAHKVTASAELSDGSTETIECVFLVAADGAKGHCRRLLNIPFISETKTADRMISASVNRIQSRTPALGPRMQTELPQDVASLQIFLDPISELDDIVFQDASWITAWRANIRMTRRLSSGRIFFAGDAAHCHSPACCQGTNTVMQDAVRRQLSCHPSQEIMPSRQFNLAWKLALVHQQRAAPDLLVTYDTERLLVIAEMLGLSSALNTVTARRQLPLEPDRSRLPLPQHGTVCAVRLGVERPGRDCAPFFRALPMDLFHFLGECNEGHLVPAFFAHAQDLAADVRKFGRSMARVVVIGEFETAA